MKQIKTRREIDELCESIVQKYEGENYIEKPVDLCYKLQLLQNTLP